MPNEFIPITYDDLNLSPEDAKLIADGAAVFLRPQPDPEDDEKLIDDAGN